MTDNDVRSGFVKWFDAKKGYGFISLTDDIDNESDDIFVHYSNIDMEGFRKLDQGDEVQFEIQENEDNEKGPEALNVKIKAKDRRY
jgi:CspA family cold shock protein